ncbi:MAG: hypothetical protein IT183_14455 [Acidobacteria bacterium]|nr:hypothetical protein [Acidobacteriota bacterium]
MATHRRSILGAATTPDTAGACWQEPYSILATNDVWGYLIWRFGSSNAAAPTTRIGLRGNFNVPKNYVGSAKIIVVWTATGTSGDVAWDFDYRAVGGNDAESLDQAGTQESATVTDTAPSAAHERMEAQITLTASNLAADDTVQFELFRDGTDAADTMAFSAIVHDVLFEYADV